MRIGMDQRNTSSHGYQILLDTLFLFFLSLKYIEGCILESFMSFLYFQIFVPCFFLVSMIHELMNTSHLPWMVPCHGSLEGLTLPTRVCHFQAHSI